MRRPLNFDRMISEGAELWRDAIKRLDDAEEFVVATATDAQLQVLAFRERVRAKRASLRGCLRQRFGTNHCRQAKFGSGRSANRLSTKYSALSIF